MKILKLIFSAEMFFVIYLTSGVYKETLDFPIDVTVFFLVLSVLMAIRRFLKRPVLRKGVVLPLILMAVFMFLLAVSLVYTPSTIYGLEKTYRFILITAPAFITLFFLLQDTGSIKRFLSAFVLLGTLLSAVMVFRNLNSDTGFVGFNEGNYLGLGQLLGVAFIIAITYFYPKSDKKDKLPLLVAILLISSALLMTGARMPLIAAVLVLGYYVFTSVKIKNGIVYVRKGFKRTISLMLVGAVAFSYMYFKGHLDTILFRLRVLFESDGGGASVSARVARYDKAWEMWLENPFLGSGVGSFGLAYNGYDGREYPHNIFLELLSENGLAALIVFALLLITVLNRFVISAKMKSPLAIAVIGAFVYTLINANVSGSLNDHRLMFSFMAATCMLPVLLKVEKNQLKHEISK